MTSENLPQDSTRRRLRQPSSSLIFPVAFMLSLLSKTMGCISGHLMTSASDQKLFCEVCSAFSYSSDEFVGEKVVSPSYSSTILAPPPLLSLLTALVLVSYGPGGSLGCDLSQNHVLAGRKTLRLLGQMRKLSPRFCLQDRKDFTIPPEMVEGGQFQEAQAISVLHEMLQQSFTLFHTERSSAAWDTTLLEQLRTGLLQQLEDLGACLGRVMGEEDSALGRTGPTLAVKRYFQGIHVYLQEKGYSDCAWEIVRLEVMRSFSSSTSLQDRLRMMDGDQNSPSHDSH